MPAEQPEHGAAAEELRPVHLAADQLVDEVVLERSCLVAAVVLDSPCRFPIQHRTPFKSGGLESVRV
jgi:hypothetical protein